MGPTRLAVFVCEPREGWGGGARSSWTRRPGGGGDPPFLYGKEAFIYYFVFIRGVHVYKQRGTPMQTPDHLQMRARGPRPCGWTPATCAHSGPNLEQTPISPPSWGRGSHTAGSLGSGHPGSRRCLGRSTDSRFQSNVSDHVFRFSEPPSSTRGFPGSRGCRPSSDFALTVAVNTSHGPLRGPRQQASFCSIFVA